MPIAAALRLASIPGLSTSSRAAPVRLASSEWGSKGAAGMVMTTPSRCIHAAMSHRTAGSADEAVVPCRCLRRLFATATSSSPSRGPFCPVLPCPLSKSIGSRLSPEPRSEVFSPTPLSSVSEPLPSLLPLPLPESFFAPSPSPPSDPSPEPELTPCALPFPEPSPEPPPEPSPEPEPEPEPPNPEPARFWLCFFAAAMALAAAVDPFSVRSLDAASDFVDHSRNLCSMSGRSGWTSTCSHVHASYGSPHHLTSTLVFGSEPESEPPLPELVPPPGSPPVPPEPSQPL